MAIDLNDLVEGLDPSGLTQISGAQLLQMVRNAVTADSKFFGIFDEATPDVVTTPRYARYSWFKPSEILNPIERRWSGVAWVPVSIGNEVITTDMIEDGAVTLPKLFVPSVGDELKLLRVNAAHTGFELWTLSNPVKSVTLAMLSSAGGIDGYLIKVNASGGFDFFELDASQYIPDGSIFPEQLAPGNAGEQYRVNAAGDEVVFFVPDSTLIQVNGFSQNIGSLANLDIILTKPALATWRRVEAYCNFNTSDAIVNVLNSMKVDLTFQTAPNVGTVISGGNSGQVFLNPYVTSPYNALVLGRRSIPSGLSTIDSITLRAAFTQGTVNDLIANAQFYVVGYYSNNVT